MDLMVLIEDREEKVTLEREGDTWTATVGETTYRLDSKEIRSAADTRLLSLVVEGHGQFEVAVRHERRRGAEDGVYQVATGALARKVEVVAPLAHLAREAHRGVAGTGLEQVTAYMPGRVVEILVEEGAEVTAGQGVVVLEAMKMENEIQAERDGVVRRLLVEAGQAVEGGDPLFEIE